MPKTCRRGFLLGACLIASAVMAATAQQELTAPHVVHVLGLDGVRRNASGTVKVEGGTLQFQAGTQKVELAISSIEDVFTGADSARVVGGTLGTISMFAPYEAGRFLSLFRKKIDTLTVEYRDSNGALHGAIFTMPKGEAVVVKKELVTAGARTSIPVEEEMKTREQKEKNK